MDETVSPLLECLRNQISAWNEAKGLSYAVSFTDTCDSYRGAEVEQERAIRMVDFVARECLPAALADSGGRVSPLEPDRPIDSISEVTAVRATADILASKIGQVFEPCVQVTRSLSAMARMVEQASFGALALGFTAHAVRSAAMANKMGELGLLWTELRGLGTPVATKATAEGADEQ